MSVRIIEPGWTTFQDGGREGFTDIGVPGAGPFDLQRYASLCELMDLPNLVSLEILGGRLVFGTEEEVVCAVVGGELHINGGLWPSNTVIAVAADSIVTVSPLAAGPAYIAIAGIAVSQVLGSASYDSLSRLGPEPLSAGKMILTSASRNARVGAFLHPAHVPDTISVNSLRITAGPHWSEDIPKEWRVEVVTRSGVRLKTLGEPYSGIAKSMTSFPVLPGCIQMPPSGDPIILGPDSGVTGGYPVVASIISADLALAARLTPGQRVVLSEVSVEEAYTVWAECQSRSRGSIVHPEYLGT
jgi:allophanate hydrolase subunit 2